MPSAFVGLRPGESGFEKQIGEILREANNLSAEEVQNIVLYQQEHNIKFGEAAMALGLVNQEEVLWALSQQFHYAYANQAIDQLGPELVIAHKPFCEQSEIFRGIRSHLCSTLFSNKQQRAALAVTSTESGDGKTFFAANLAVGFSQLGGRTLLIDANMRAPRLHDVFGVENRVGLSGVLSRRAGSSVIKRVNGLPGLYVLPVGIVPPNPLELLQSQAFELLLKVVVSKFDYVLVDTPSGSAGIDARVIAANCGAAVAIARKDKTRTDALRNLLGPLSRGSVNMTGVVMNEY